MREGPQASNILGPEGLANWESGKEFSPFVRKQHKLSTMKGCLLWDDRVVIPHTLQKRTLETLHSGHPGIVRMKALAQSPHWTKTSRNGWNGSPDVTLARKSDQCPPQCGPWNGRRPAAPSQESMWTSRDPWMASCSSSWWTPSLKGWR